MPDAMDDVLLVAAGAATGRWRAALAGVLPDLRITGTDLPDWQQHAPRIAWVVAWRPAAGLFAQLPALRVVFALGAGIDALVGRDDLAGDVALVKLADAGMAAQMTEYALLGVLDWQRRLTDYALLQARSEWRPLPPRQRHETRVTVLGLGAIGSRVAAELAGLGYDVHGWSRSTHAIDGVCCSHGESALAALLARSDVLVNLLPSTAATRGLLDRARLSLLPAGACVVAASRGDQLDAQALREALDAGRLSSAWLDVFAEEPLPPTDPLWRHPRVHVTPHVAAITLEQPALDQIVANLARLARGEPLQHEVERARGY